MHKFQENKSINTWLEVAKFFVGQSDHTAAALLAATADQLPHVLDSNTDFVSLLQKVFICCVFR
jgi:hypothetical protein